MNYELVCTRCLNVGKWKMAGAWPTQARAETETMDQGDGMIACVVGGEEVGQTCGWKGSPIVCSFCRSATQRMSKWFLQSTEHQMESAAV